MTDPFLESELPDLERRALLRIAGAAALLLPACGSGPLPYPPGWHQGSSGGAGGTPGGQGSGSAAGSSGAASTGGASSGGTSTAGGSTGQGASSGNGTGSSGGSSSGSTTGPATSSGGTTGGGTTGGGTTGGGTTTGGASSSGSTAGGSTGGVVCPRDANTLAVSLAGNPQLATVGGSVSLTDSRYSDPVCGQNGFIVIQVSQGQFVALSDSCTHQCCQVQPTQGQLFCYCHGSSFDFQGNVTGGPAGQALPSLPVCFDGSTVYVKLA